jgi:hypothetical protein
LDGPPSWSPAGRVIERDTGLFRTLHNPMEY